MAPNRKELYDRIFPVTRDPSDIPLPRTNITPWYALGWILTGQEVRNQFDPQGVVDDMDPIATAIRCRFFKQKLNETAAADFCPELFEWHDCKWVLRLTLNGSQLSQFVEKQNEITELLMKALEVTPEFREKMKWIRMSGLEK